MIDHKGYCCEDNITLEKFNDRLYRIWTIKRKTWALNVIFMFLMTGLSIAVSK